MVSARPMGESGGSGFVRGWTGKILVVDLGTRQIGETATEDYAREYVGGRGIAARLYWELTNPQIKPLDPENPLIFMTGPLTGTCMTAATIMSVVGKSPAALPESYCYGTIGGYLGTELKKAGFDGVVVTGRADVPSYLWINDGKVEIRDAGGLWGKNALETAAALIKEHGAKARFLVIGVSGEKLVRTATAYASHEGSLSCGYGAVMGSKNLKGILVRGTGEIEVADSDGLRELNRRVIRSTSVRIWRSARTPSAPDMPICWRSSAKDVATTAVRNASATSSATTAGWRVCATAKPPTITSHGFSAATKNRSRHFSTPQIWPTTTASTLLNSASCAAGCMSAARRGYSPRRTQVFLWARWGRRHFSRNSFA